VSVNDGAVLPGPRNAYGERSALWAGPVAPGPLAILARGVVEVENRAGVVAGLTRRMVPDLFLRATLRTRADRAVQALAAAPPGDDRLGWLHALMGEVHARVAYVTGSTNSETTAAEALSAGSGVCQDHAHIFAAAARAHGVPARYVCGYLLAGTGEYELHETHAWAEAWVEGLGWVGFDPSHNMCPTENYVRLTVGLDASDAAPIRGHASGGVSAGLFADVRIATSDLPLTNSGAPDGQVQALQMNMQVQQQQYQKPRTSGA
jgi:transglutaminase-like putative cysteine protease